MKRRIHINHAVLVLGFIAISTLGCGNDPTVENDDTLSPEEEYLSEYDGPSEKWGFLDTKGLLAIDPRYDQVSSFTEGLAAANFRGKWGFIDRAGDVQVEFKYLAAWPFSNGFARVEIFEGGQCFIDRSGKETCPEGVLELRDQSGGFFQAITLGGTGFVDQAGKYVVDPIYDRATSFENGYAVLYRGEKALLIDIRLDTVLRGKYRKIYPPSDGFICVRRESGFSYLTMDGQPSGLGEFERAKTFSENRAAVKVKGLWRLIDVEGNVIADGYEQLRYAGNQRWVAKKRSGTGLIDHNGNAITDFSYDQINDFSEDLAAFQKNFLCGYLNTTGEEVIPAQYGLAWDFNEGLARAAFRDGIAFIDYSGNLPFIPKYFEIRDYSEGRAAFQENP